MGGKLFEILKKTFSKKNFQKKHFFFLKEKINAFFQKNKVLVYRGKKILNDKLFTKT